MLSIHCFLEMSKFDMADCHWCIMVSLRCIKYFIQQFRLIASDTSWHTLTQPDCYPTVKLTFLFNLFVLHYKIFHKTVEGPGTGLNVRLFDFYQVGGLGSVCFYWWTVGDNCNALLPTIKIKTACFQKTIDPYWLFVNKEWILPNLPYPSQIFDQNQDLMAFWT